MQGKKIATLITFVVIGLFVAWLIATNDLVAQVSSEDKHDEHDHDDHDDHDEHAEKAEDHDDHAGHDEHEDVVKFSDAEMKKFGIEVATAGPGKFRLNVSLPGEIAVNEDRIAHVTPRVPGVVREVRKTLGDRVRAGETMAVLDSSEMSEAKIAYLNALVAVNVGKAQLDLAGTKLEVVKVQRELARTQVGVTESDYDLAGAHVTTAQNTVEVKGAEAKIAKTDLEWQQTVHDNTAELLKMLGKKATIDGIAEAFKGKPIGANRERTLKAYAELTFAQSEYERERTLREKGISSESDFLAAQRGYTGAKAEFEAITEELEFQNRLALMDKKRTVEAAGRDVKEAEQSVKVAQGAVKAAEQDIRAAQQTVQAAEMEVLVAKADVKVAQQTLEVANSTLRAAEQKLHIFGLDDDEIAAMNDAPSDGHPDATRYVMRAPFDGVVIEKHIVLGEALKDDTEAFVVADLSSVWVNVNVYQKDLSVVRKGLSIVLSGGHDLPTAKGTLSWISPRIDKHTRTAFARVVLPNPDGHWRPGLFVTAKIDVDEIEVPLLVPKVALQMVEERLSVFVKTDEGFEAKPVTLGRSTETYAEVTKGLQTGQRYVTKGAFTLKAELGKGAFGDGHAH